REHPLLRQAARHDARADRGADRRAGRGAADGGLPRPPDRGLQPGPAHQDRDRARAGARPAQRDPGRADQRPGRDDHARAAWLPRPPARRRPLRDLLQPHHAGGGRAVRSHRGGRPRPRRGAGHARRAARAGRARQPRGCIRDPDRFGRGAARMKAMWTVCLKELRELARDRRTLLLLLVMGPLLVPALMIGVLTLAQKRAQSQIEKPLEIAIVGADRAPELVKWLAGEGITRKSIAGDPDAAIRDQDEDAYLRIGDDYGAQWRSGAPALVEIVHDSTRQDSSIPVRRIESALQ